MRMFMPGRSGRSGEMLEILYKYTVSSNSPVSMSEPVSRAPAPADDPLAELNPAQREAAT
ncbi:ATP-dependent DNA helicase [Bordetella pertussis]|nr:ATP-dependent DNA helicase [Bordetella pertussis]